MRYDNRTDPLFRGTNMTNSLNLGLTTHCSMVCPNCTIEIPKHRENKTAVHALPSDIARDAQHMKGLRRVHLTGGEPTLHPVFREIVMSLHEWFEYEYLTIETNGVYYERYRNLFSNYFDRVFITHYVKDKIYPGSPDNTAIIEQAEKDLKDRLVREEPVTHLPFHQLGIKTTGAIEVPCSKWIDPGLPCAWYNRKLYSCCVTVGIDESLGIPVTANWREEIQKQLKGCANCCFRGT